MVSLENLAGERLTLLFSEVSLPRLDVLKVENRLLDGSLHIQTMGYPLTTIKATAVTTEELARNIDQKQSIQEEFFFVKHGERFKGLIREPITWAKIGRYTGKDTKFSGELEFVILETS